MVMPIEKYLLDTGPAIFYDEAFRSVLEDHLTFLRTHETTSDIVVTAIEAMRWRCDFYGLLETKGVSKHMHYITARVNNIKSSVDFQGEILEILIPNEDLVMMIAQTHQTVHKLR